MNHKTVNQILHQTKDIYNRIASDFSRTRAFNWPGFETLVGQVKPGSKVLDLGCGNGRMADIFLDKNVSYFGIDNSEKLIDLARIRYAGREGVDFKVGDMADLQDFKKDFDLVLAIASLHHLPTIELRLKVLENIFRLLKKDGRAIISVWNLWQPRYWRYLFNYRVKVSHGVWSLQDAFVPWKIKGDWQMRYVHAYTAGELRSLLVNTGLKIDDIYYESRGERSGIFKGGNLLAIVSKK